MSQENVEIVRGVYEAEARRDRRTVLSLYDSNVELDCSRIEVAGLDDIYRGYKGLRRFFQVWHDGWENVGHDYDELIDAGDNVVSVVTRRTRAAGVELNVALVWTIHDGQVARVDWHPTRAEALEAAELEA
jgi:ketosteroid isomerase-like protein